MTDRACPFASPSVAEHLARGAGAAVLLVATYWLFQAAGPLRIGGAVATLVGAVILMRGCPTCWLTGLVATIAARSRRPAREPEPRLQVARAASALSASTRPAAVPTPR